MGILISMFITIFPMFMIGLVLIIIIKKHMKNMNEKKEQFKQLPGVRVELHDLLHIMKKGHKRVDSYFLAVYKDTTNNKFYIPGRMSYLANPLVSYAHLIGKPPSITVRTHGQKQVEPLAKGTLRIAQQQGSVIVDGQMVTMENIRCTYKGSVHELTVMRPEDFAEIRNSVDNPRILEELQNATIVDGLIEFDVDMYQG